jgi:hypothetical protein
MNYDICAEKGWTLTDPDTGQWVKRIEQGFLVHDYDVEGRGEVNFYQPTKKTEAQLNEIVDGYYNSIQEVQEVYGGDWPMIVAEIMSEKEVCM